jgi:hypothetical protein
MANALRGGITPAVSVILEYAVVIFLQMTEQHYLNDLLHINQFSSKWQLAPFYKTGAIDNYKPKRRVEFL